MMHAEAWEFLEKVLPPLNHDGLRVVEFGSRDVNGSTRTLVPLTQYTGIDIEDGPGVDIVADAADWNPDRAGLYDLVISTETFEHTPRWPEICRTAFNCLTPGGLLVVTAATAPRAPHSAVDGHHLEYEGEEYYGNVDPGVLESVLRVCGFLLVDVIVHPRGDVYATAMP